MSRRPAQDGSVGLAGEASPGFINLRTMPSSACDPTRGRCCHCELGEATVADTRRSHGTGALNQSRPPTGTGPSGAVTLPSTELRAAYSTPANAAVWAAAYVKVVAHLLFIPFAAPLHMTVRSRARATTGGPTSE